MEKRKEKLSTIKMCRFCLSENDSLENLFDRNSKTKDSVNLQLKILTCVSVEVFPSDKMPYFICSRCKFLMNMFYEYKMIVRQADENILHYIQSGTELKSILWPPSLVKAFKYSGEFRVVKTTVEGGTTVQVSSQDASESDEEDASIYNIKIGDGNNDTACIKVVSSKDNEDGVEESRGSKELDNRTVKKSSSDREEGCWPCDQCDCNYPLQQLLDLHKLQKHRARNIECDKCDAKFFSKYDLATHLLRHTSETPFSCVVCGKKFKRNILLKRHEKIMHLDLPQHACPKCPATFIQLEQLRIHGKKHGRTEPLFPCTVCEKKFNDKTLLHRHKEVVHNKTATHQCDYCPERFVTMSKLARHVRGHAGERPYPCKFCDKTFTKSHHYTRHLRVKHREALRSSREADQYRCEQCDDTFATQDDLIYHSAIHTTQNLTCPLCQEKYDDVDAVTAHIKSHVSGDQFMCDYCELMFTAKDKLDTHLLVAHEDDLQAEQPGENESSMDAEDEDDDNGISVKEDGDSMLVEVKKPNAFMIKDNTEQDEKIENTNSEESEVESTYTELGTVDTLAVIQKQALAKVQPEKSVYKSAEAATITPRPNSVKQTPSATKSTNPQLSKIVRKAEEIKRKTHQQTLDTMLEKKEKPTNSQGASDKSLRLLEKELQDLKRTNSRSEVVKTPAKTGDMVKGRRIQIHTSTPKTRPIEEKKAVTKTPALFKKVVEKVVPTKENKEPKENKESRNNSSVKEDKDTPKGLKNGSSDKDEGIRRSTRPSKIKDYAKMVRDKPQGASDEDSDDDDDDEEYQENETRHCKLRRSSVKLTPKTATALHTATPVIATAAAPAHTPTSTPAATPTSTPAPTTTPARKRGRPRKEPQKEVPVKVRKENEPSVEGNEVPKLNAKKTKSDTEASNATDASANNVEVKQSPSSAGVLFSPTGQTLKKVPVKALPPGVKAMPLPPNARTVPSGDLCEMQIGKKVVKVQKIVMTRAEVEAMAKKGLLEMKDGTMVLKQGIKLPTTDPASIKSTLVGEADTLNETTIKKEKAAPSRCDLNEEM